MKDFNLDHVERLSRGKRSGAKIGSRAVGHNLRPHERAAYRRALEKGYLDITEQDRANLWHIWEKACVASERPFLVLVKSLARDTGLVYHDNQLVAETNLANAKAEISRLAG